MSRPTAGTAAAPVLLLRVRDGWLAYAGTLVGILLIVGFVIYPRIDEVRSGRALMAKLERASAGIAELGLAGAKEQYLLQLRRPVVNFGHARWREREVEARYRVLPRDGGQIGRASWRERVYVQV
jgi:hypothetical protein